MIAFGPVPSRRLGSSLGINHIPPKNCTYSCVYCQVGRTSSMSIERRGIFKVNEIIQDVDNKLRDCDQHERKVDYLTLVPDGEPTLDINLGKIIDGLKQFQIPVAVISNASLINRIDVQNDLQGADWVSLKVDTLDAALWKKIDRPHGKLHLDGILQGITKFRSRYTGKFVTETMLVNGLNDNWGALEPVIAFLKNLNTFTSYFSIPTRPPSDDWVQPPDARFLQEFLVTTSRQLPSMDVLFEAEPNDFQSTGDLPEDILAITSVHPLREEVILRMVEMAGQSNQVIESLVNSGEIIRVKYQSGNFYVRNFASK